MALTNISEKLKIIATSVRAIHLENPAEGQYTVTILFSDCEPVVAKFISEDDAEAFVDICAEGVNVALNSLAAKT